MPRLETANLILSELLPIELTNGNDGRGSKWFRSATLRERYELQLRHLGYERKPFETTVEVQVTRVLGKGQRLWDPSSIGRGNWKEIEDSLVALGWWQDDSPKWISEVRFFQDKTRRQDGPATLVEVYERPS